MRSGRAAFCLLIGLSVLPIAPARAEQWESIGPFGAPLINNDVISGQVIAIAVDPRDANILYIGAPEGGVWKTSNGGGFWTPLTDKKLVRKLPSGKTKGTLSIGALAINPTNPSTVYAGTGDPNMAIGIVGPGLGVFRSTDGGSTWSPLGVNLSQSGCQNGVMSERVVNRLVVVPGRPAVLFAATDFGLFSYAETGSDCWLPSSGFGRIALAYGGRSLGFSAPQPIVYAGFDTGGGPYRLFVTRDAGSTWTELPSPPSEGQHSLNNVIAVGSYDSD